MVHNARLVVNVTYVSGHSKNIDSFSRHIDLACLPCFGRLLTDPACLLCLVNVPATSTLAKALFLKWIFCKLS